MRFVLLLLLSAHALFPSSREAEVRELFEQKFLASSIEIGPLGVGLTNRNFQVIDNGQNFFVRMGTANASLLYISREIERQCYAIAQELDLAPPLVYCDTARGILVTPFIFNAANYGKVHGSWTGDAKQVISRSIKAMKRIHSVQGLSTKETPYPFRIMNYYYKIGHELGVSFPDDLEKAIAIAKNLDISFGQKVLCHHDFYWGNILFDGNKLWVVD